MIQIVNYGIGGYYTRHTDYFDEGRDTEGYIGKLIANSGDRVATFLIYVSACCPHDVIIDGER